MVEEMTDGERINLNDPLFLVSRSLDGDLSAAEQFRLDEALAASVELRAEADRLGTVARLIEARRTTHAQIDWNTHEKLVLTEIAHGTPGLADVDQLLHDWSARRPQYDERQLADGIMARIAPARVRSRSKWRIVARLGAPLAAAAAVVLAVTASWFAPAPEISLTPVMVVQIGPPDADESNAPEMIVSFTRPKAIPSDSGESLSFGYMTLGSSPMGPLEEAPL